VSANETTPAPAIPVEDMTRAALLAAEVATELGLRESDLDPEAPIIKRIKGHAACDVVAAYQWVLTRPREGAVTLTVAVPKTRSAVEFLIRDVSTSRESALAQELRAALQRRLEADLPEYPVQAAQGEDRTICVP
jgi:hypothetical protein